MEHKILQTGQVNVDENSRTVTGFPSIFGISDLGNDLIPLGAFKKTIQESANKVKWLWYHNLYEPAPPTAKILDIQEVGREELPEVTLGEYPNATGGLKVVRQYLETERANEVFTGIREGVIDQMSIGFEPIQVEYPEDMIQNNRPVNRIIKEIKLMECSDLLWGMNDATTNQKMLFDMNIVIKRFLTKGEISEQEFKTLEEIFLNNPDATVKLFQKLLGESYTVIKKSDTLEDEIGELKNVSNSNELLARILEFEIEL